MNGDGKPWNKLSVQEKQAADPARFKKERRQGNVLLAVIGVALLGGCAALLGGDDETATPGASTPQATSTTAAPPASNRPTTPPATNVATPAQSFEAAVREKLGESNRDAVRVQEVQLSKGVAEVKWAINENLTENLTRLGARMDAKDIIQLAKDVPGLRQLRLTGTYLLQNNLGETSERQVVQVAYSGDVVKRVQLDAIELKSMFDIADVESSVLPIFQNE